MNYNKLKNVDIQLIIDKLETINVENQPSIFLYFTYLINNQSNIKAFFDQNRIRIKANGTINEATFYGASTDSTIPDEIELPEGKSSYYLYAVFSDANLEDGINRIAIEHSGVTFETLEQ